MPAKRWLVMVLVCLAVFEKCCADAQETPSLAHVVDSLRSGETAVRVVCFGDSITGVYYHTGGRRAWCDMLGIALGKIYPKAQIEMINAGISGHTTTLGLARMEKDVIAHKPQLVVVMFGMNDVVGTEPKVFEDNLRTIVARARAGGAAVVLCTPNSVYPNPTRPMDRLARFAQVVRDVAADLSVPLADCVTAYEEVRREDVTRWRLLMSETIHPGMNGHKLFAEVIAQKISGRRVSLADEPPPADALSFTLARLAEKQPLEVVAMPPFDEIVPDALRGLFPEAKINVTPWPVEGQSLTAIEEWARGIRAKRPHLVVVAVPADRTAEDEETFIRLYSWVLNWSVDFGLARWDLMPILPSVAGPLADDESQREELVRRIIMSMDTRWVQRPPGDARPAAEIVSDWINQQASAALKIVAFGDSITAFRNTIQKVYSQRLAEVLPAQGISAWVVNSGVGGHTTADARARFERDVLAHRPDVVLIMLGANDSAIDVWKDPPATRSRVSREEYAENLAYFSKTLKEQGAKVVLMTPTPFRWTPQLKELYGKPPYDADDPNGFSAPLSEYCEIVRKTARAEGATLIDLFQAFEDYDRVDGQSVDDLLLDGMHPNDEGHRLITDLILPEILKLAPGDGPQ